ncbi:NAD(P)/FAD-dependent oxidoreductase [Halomonas denitrificans]|uniref:NAD(P)/FAD-dependent oxidoreductase n=1 Tax=Halomonas TaxID=2745 RepID=UPI001C984644|nr:MULTISPECIES: NAD(P)/FAD-dependent oxidoreductase [Halomonas]MBY5930697.1 NAD(P)/FAD-dependent oxidoreductase [Halomonas sp. DP8Y7-3]MBY5984879.1 NAD(P)/FAD-dependent oxidoreductase [Halomonas sp. DP5Y7-2]MBY6207924.1 NAD(P)/FAD-dependent oxidoreductase [Halomonas sp. DP3Y7-2]MBY6228733.1 NAD(P)/FAD-dependent oxidoreductase [Halomonas sp. DP3Y7-1]MCA0917283.1 NAD(P)/FAD-dependent oxidoreductase [Halomonas denitrificans]
MKVDVVIIGAGAAGLMCALTAGYAGRSVMVIDHANKPGKKILMSGGGRCNFTNMATSAANFFSANPHFCISALKRYRPDHFVELVERHGLEYVEKAPGQLFCADSAKDLLNVLLTECDWAGVELCLKTRVERIERQGEGMRLTTSAGRIEAGAVVIATGGLSIPTMGASGFGYDIARQFGLEVTETRAALVPFTLTSQWKERASALSGLSTDVVARCRGGEYREPLLFTHRGLSGPAMLQISSYWQPGDDLEIDLLPGEDAFEALCIARRETPKRRLSTWLSERYPKRLAQALVEWHGDDGVLAERSNASLASWAESLNRWRIKPAGTEGWRTAEVTMGGVAVDAISSKTFEVQGLPQLRFIGEVLDVTGELGGYNFQWAWASAVACGQSL